MATFLLSHRHAPAECRFAFAAWRGFDSPLRHSSALATCGGAPEQGGAEHMLIWTVEAESDAQAMSLLPPWLAERTEVRLVGEVSIP